ncbi:MAG: hypothetical protein WD847_01945 [Pirellulales bacterium]
MAQSENVLGLFLHLARASEQRNRPWVRDKFLVLAAVTASQDGLEQIAAFCRRKILSNNPGHLVGHHESIADALDDERFRGFLIQLRKRYSRERAEHMLSSLDIDLASERDSYFSDHEYAAALLGTSPEELEELFNGPWQPDTDAGEEFAEDSETELVREPGGGAAGETGRRRLHALLILLLGILIGFVLALLVPRVAGAAQCVGVPPVGTSSNLLFVPVVPLG